MKKDLFGDLWNDAKPRTIDHMKLAKLKKDVRTQTKEVLLNGKRSIPGDTAYFTACGMAASIPTKLDLGCGPHPKPGFTGVDCTRFPGVEIVHDLTTEWPFADNSIEEAHSSHCIEHFDAMERVHFLNELYRVLKPGAKCTLIAPHWSSCRAYGDPTHKWPPVSEFAFFYWKKEWRMANAPHTDASVLKGGFNCNFDVTWGYSLNGEVAQRNQEYQQYAMTFLKEAVMDVISTLTALK